MNMKLKITPLTVMACTLMLFNIACSKKNPAPISPQTSSKTCRLVGIEQPHQAGKPVYSLTLAYNGNQPQSLSIFDSLNNTRIHEANFTMPTPDSILIDPYQYLILDQEKRVVVFVTRANVNLPNNTDTYRYQYTYNADGYLSKKTLYVNGSNLAYSQTNYTYNNNLLVTCEMSIGSVHLKVVESTLTYHTNLIVKDWLYMIPDAHESYMYSTVFNFGKKPNRALAQVTTNILHPSNGSITESWITTYGNYSINADGYVEAVTTQGDLQRGMPAMHGKTVFKYQCQ